MAPFCLLQGINEVRVTPIHDEDEDYMHKAHAALQVTKQGICDPERVALSVCKAERVLMTCRRSCTAPTHASQPFRRLWIASLQRQATPA